MNILTRTRWGKLFIAAIVGLTVAVGHVGFAHATVQVGLLPVTDQLLAFSSDRSASQPNLYRVDASTAATTAVGSTGPVAGKTVLWSGAAFNPVTNTSYVIGVTEVNTTKYYTLYTVNTATGAFTKIADITNDGSTLIAAYGLAITPSGVAYVVNESTHRLYSLNLDTAIATVISASNDFNGTTSGSVKAFTSDPTTSKLYVSIGNAYLYELNPTTGGATAVGSHFTGGTGGTADWIQSMQFDTNGTLWFLYEDCTSGICLSYLWSANIAQFNNTNPVKIGRLTGGLTTKSYALLRAPVPTVTFLANGGSGTMPMQRATTPTALTTNAYTFSNRTFSSWNTAANGTGTKYDNGSSYGFAANLTLYAQWKDVPAEELPKTGVNESFLVAGSVLLLAVGAGLIWVTRRRTTR